MYARNLKICIIPIIVVFLCSFLSLGSFAVEAPDIIYITPNIIGSGTPSPAHIMSITWGLEFDRDNGDYIVVYLGNVDTVNHTLTITGNLANYNGYENWRTNSNIGYYLIKNENTYSNLKVGSAADTYPYIYCNMFESSSTAWNDNCIGLQNQTVWIGTNDFNNVDDFKTFIENHTLEFVYPYETPITYNLSENELNQILEYFGYDPINPNPPDPEPPDISDYWQFIEDFFSQLFNFNLPWGITFGAVVVGIFGAPLIVKAYKKFF